MYNNTGAFCLLFVGGEGLVSVIIQVFSVCYLWAGRGW